MARQSNILDDVQIRRWVAKGEPVAKSDGDGLTFTLSAAGTAAWVLRYRMGAGRRKEVTLGNYPDLTLANARKAARAHRVAIDEGRDPAAEKQSAKSRSLAAWQVRTLCDDYVEKILVAPLADTTIYYRKHDIEGALKTRLGAMEVRNVTPSDIVHMLESSGLTWTVTRRLLTSTKQVFAHAVGKRMIDVNPASGIDIKAIKGKRPPVRKRIMLTEAELRALLPTIDDTIGRANGLMFRLLLATCVRTRELARAKVVDIDFDRGTWLVQSENVKTREGFLVPVAPQAAEWFRELVALAGDSQWLLPARTETRRRRLGGDAHVGHTTLWAAFQRAFLRNEMPDAVRRFTPHDTRSTAKGHMRNMGISNEVSELALNHKMRGMEAIYDVREEIPEKRSAMELWAAFVDSCTTAQPWNVVAFQAA
ncbi:integrase arm-type DNA-binding domain-containing protein [Pandoraea pnomenusa]|uniref:tyrosine-type recombinase/integrase n=1 Tax=Pandoraea pnomenusa TaxID=93220 RepID=UPI00333F73D6